MSKLKKINNSLLFFLLSPKLANIVTSSRSTKQIHLFMSHSPFFFQLHQIMSSLPTKVMNELKIFVELLVRNANVLGLKYKQIEIKKVRKEQTPSASVLKSKYKHI